MKRADGRNGRKTGPLQRLSVRLALSFLIPTALGLAGVAYVADHVARQAFEEQLGERLIAVADAERAMLSGYFADLAGRVEGDDTRSLENLRKRIDKIASETGVRRVFLFHPETHASIVDTDESVPFGAVYYELDADRPEIEKARGGESVASVLYSAEDGTPYKFAYAPLYDESGALVAVIGVEGEAAHLAELTSFRRSLLLLGLVALGLILATAVFVSRRITRPIASLVDATKRIGEGQLEEAVPTTRDDELGALEASIDAMRLALRDREEELQMMLTGIAHEVRNPLGGIELFLGLLEEDLAAAGHLDGDPLRQHVTTISRELEYLARVVKEFLEFARRSAVETTRWDAASFVGEIQDVMSGDLMGRDVELTIEHAEGLELTGDRDRIKRVVVNLVRNAAQATEPGTTIELTIDEPSAALRRIVVTDQGSGIDAETLANIFRPFFTTREKGTGLGLPLARKVIEAHGGSLDLTSSVGSGTTATIMLPFDTALEASGVAMAIPEGWLG